MLFRSPSVTPTRRPTSPGGQCLPKDSAQSGKVLDVVDGATIKVLIGDLMYVVRYIGVKVPDDPTAAQLSTVTNGQLVFSKAVKLYVDGPEKDEANRLLRYVVVDDATVVNQAIIRAGMATAVDGSYGCVANFSGAEQDAMAEHVGIWKTSKP